MKHWHKAALAFLAVAAAIFVLSLFFAAKYQICEHNEYSAKEDCTLYHFGPFALLTAANFLRGYSDLITGLATALLAVITWMLVALGKDQSAATKTQLRAYVFATDLRQYWEKTPAGEYVWRFRPVWTNSGDTPTRGLTVHTECEVRNSPLPANFDFNYPVIPGGGLIAPKTFSEGGIAPEAPKAAVTPQDILDAQANRKFIYIFGWVRYRDVFEDTPPHITRFCWMLVTTGDPRTFAPDDPNHKLNFAWVHQARGNCSDGECLAQGMG